MPENAKVLVIGGLPLSQRIQRGIFENLGLEVKKSTSFKNPLDGVDEALGDVDAVVVNVPMGSGIKGRPGGEEAVLYVRSKSKEVLIYTCNSDPRAGVVMGANGHVQDVSDKEHAAYKTLGGLIKNEPRRVVDFPADADIL